MHALQANTFLGWVGGEVLTACTLPSDGMLIVSFDGSEFLISARSRNWRTSFSTCSEREKVELCVWQTHPFEQTQVDIPVELKTSHSLSSSVVLRITLNKLTKFKLSDGAQPFVDTWKRREILCTPPWLCEVTWMSENAAPATRCRKSNEVTRISHVARIIISYIPAFWL